MIAFLVYLATIVLANVAITIWGFVSVGFGLQAPAGVFFAGFALGARDWLQESKGRGWTIGAIVLGAGLSAFLSPALAVASGAAFLVSELADMGVYSPLRREHVYWAVLLSNSVGLVIDSALFLYLAFGDPWTFLPGQVVAKTYTTLACMAVLWAWRTARQRRQVAYA